MNIYSHSIQQFNFKINMRVVLSGYYGMGNGGDEALLAVLLQMLPASVQPLVLSGNPRQTAEQYGVETCDRKSYPAVWRALGRSDAFIWGGGSLIQDATSALSPFYYAGLMSLAQRRGLKTIAWAQGIGPLKRPPTRWLARQTFSRCVAVSVRDRASAALLSQWQVPFTLSSDPVWALQPKTLPGLWELPAPRIAVVLRSHPQLTSSRLSVLIQALVSFQKATQTFILLLPFQPTQDLAIAQIIQSRLPDVSQILVLNQPQQLMGVFNGVELAIAMRFHGLIMAAASGCRCFALSYDPKVSQLMQELQIPGWTLAEIPEESNRVCQTWLEHYANGDALSLDQIHFQIDRALIHQEMLRTVLSES